MPLKEAWLSGARNWTPDQRQAYANDVIRPQLIAITDNVNESKGDKDPAHWMPPLASYRQWFTLFCQAALLTRLLTTDCTYVRAWITVKQYYNLSVDETEKAALSTYLDECPSDITR